MCGGAIIADFISCNEQRRRVAAADLWPNSTFAKVPSFNSNFGQTCWDDSLLDSEKPQAQSSSGDEQAVKKQEAEEESVQRHKATSLGQMGAKIVSRL